MTGEQLPQMTPIPEPVLLPPAHLAALRVLVARLSPTDIAWALTGSTSFALQGVGVAANDIDVQTDAAGAYRIAEFCADVVVQPVAFSGTERIRSHFGALSIGGIAVEVMGAVQKRLPDGGWEEPVDVSAHRRLVRLGDLTVPVLDLAYEERAYRMLGRLERADLLRRHLAACLPTAACPGATIGGQRDEPTFERRYTMARSDNVYELPADLPAPTDDGACAHLPGLAVPSLPLPSTDGPNVDLAQVPSRTIVYCYPRTGRPDQELPTGWNEIPGARGCTPEACGFRDHHAELAALGVAVFGLSTQDTAYQREAVERLRLPFALLSDAELRFATALRLPTFGVDGMTLIRRLTLVLREGVIEHVFYPVFPPDTHAETVVAWLAEHR